jgi:branched-chain amino acid transport system substrate-binding protein
VVLGGDGSRGAVLAAEDVNAHGGVNGHRLELVQLTGASSVSARVALAAAESLAMNDRVLAVVGHTNSGASLAASQIYNARHVVQIAPTSTTPLYSNAGPYSFRMVASDVHQGVYLAKEALSHGDARVAVLFVNDDYGRGLREVLVERLRAEGVKPVYDAPFAEDDRNGKHGEFDEIITSVVRAHPQVLVWVGRSRAYRDVSAAFRRELPAMKVLASDGFGGPELSHDSAHLFDGVRYVRLVDYSQHDSALKTLRQRFIEGTYPELTDQAVLSYDAVMLLAEALRHTGAKREAIREWLARVGRGSPPFEGLTGPIGFPSGGDRAPSYFMDVAGQGQLSVIGVVPKKEPANR